MAAFAGSRLSADDVGALHSRYHDTMHGTFAADRHHNLPRPLRSYVLNRSKNVSVLSSGLATAQALAPPLTKTANRDATISSPAVFHTPQWNEFSEYVRELSPPAGSRESSQAEEDSAVSSSTSHGRDAKDSDEGDRISEEEEGVQSPSAELSVVDRLAAISRSANVDPVAVAAALREAEDLLKHPTPVAVPRKKEDAVQRSCDDSSAQAGHRARSISNGGKKQQQNTKTSAAHCRERDEADCHPYDLAFPRHQNRFSAQMRPQEFRKGKDERARAVDARHASWPWPGRSPTLHAVPASPSPGLTTGDTPAATTFFPVLEGNASATDATAYWYEVYYAWMLYYQQLYATRILQCVRHQRRSQRREARRQRSRRGGDGEVQTSGTSAGTEDEHRHYCRSAALERVVQEAQADTMGRGGGDIRTSPLHHHRQRDWPSTSPPETDHRHPHRRCSLCTGHVDDAQQLRAQLQRLEDQLASLSSMVAGKGGEEQRLHKTNASHEPTVARAQQRKRASARAQSGERSGGSQLPSVAPPAQAKSTAAATWQALTERQRSRSGARADRDRRASPQRLQWR